MAKFEKGNKLSPGRPRDAISKRSLQFADKLIEAGVDPVRELLNALENAKECYENSMEIGERLTANGQIIITADKMLPYMYPKLANITVERSPATENMTAREKIEAMREAIKLLEKDAQSEEIEVKNELEIKTDTIKIESNDPL